MTAANLPAAIHADIGDQNDSIKIIQKLKEANQMKRLITVEEHYSSTAVNEKIKKVYEEHGTEEQKKSIRTATGDAAPGVTDFGAERIAYMDAHGIDAQVISYASGLPATMEPEYSSELCRDVNNEMAEKADAYPGRFYLFANLPLGDGYEAAKELERCVKELGFVGAMISGHYHDLPYDDEHYFPVFEKAQELNVPVYLHPGLVSPAISERYYKGNWSDRATFMLSGFGVGWHYDVGMQVIRMMLAGVFDRLPELKIMTGHWGELVSFYMYRTDEITQEITGLKKKISDYYKENIYVNHSGMLYAEQFRYCLDTFGANHILWGEDYPYRRKENIRSFLENFDLTDEEREKIAHGNAEDLLHINECNINNSLV